MPRGQAATLISLSITTATGYFPLIELVGIKQLLEHRLGIVVDVTTRDSLDPLLRGEIEASAERIF